MLKPRHIEVLVLAGAGYSVQETADAIGISSTHVRHLRCDAMRLYGKNTVTGAVVMALRCGVIKLDDCVVPSLRP